MGTPETEVRQGMIISMIKYNFLEKAYTKNNKVNIIGDYINSISKIKVECKKCGYIWEMLPSNILKNRGCPLCAKNQKKSHNLFLNELKFINSNIKILSTYQNSHKRIECECILCKHKWLARPTNLLRGHGCPMCLMSVGENTIKSILLNLGIEFEQQKKFDDLYGVRGGKLSFDFYLPKYNILIEYQGRQHYEPNGYLGGKEKFAFQIQNDIIKKKYAKNKKYILFEISYKDNTKKKLLSFLETVTTTGH